MTDRQALGRRIGERCRLQGEFTLRSGQVSSTYFDKYLFESDPVLLGEVAREAAELIPEGTEFLAGLELGGVPVVTALSLVTGLPAVFVRKQAKDYGTAKLAEGGAIGGRKTLVVEDVITTGGRQLCRLAICGLEGRWSTPCFASLTGAKEYTLS